MTTHQTEGYTPLGFESIDQDHTDFLKLLRQLIICKNNDLPKLFQQMQEHCKGHFERENQLMEIYSFPAEQEHRNEHDHVLNELKQIQNQIDQGNFEIAREFSENQFPQWFQLHASTMDCALVFHINLMLSNQQ